LSRLYFDAAYVAKCYLNESDAAPVRAMARKSEALYTSVLSIAEVACAFHRHRREGVLNTKTEALVRDRFLQDLDDQIWLVLPITDHIARRVESVTRTLPPNDLIRAGDAIHLISASEAGLKEIWSNDRRLLAAAASFGLTGRSV